MYYHKSLKKFIATVVIVAFIFQGNIFLHSQEKDEDLIQLEKSIDAYLAGQDDSSKMRLERLIGTIKAKGLELEKKDILGKCYLLIGAISEKKGEIILAEENYRNAKKLGIEFIEGVDLDGLPIYESVVKVENYIETQFQKAVGEYNNGQYDSSKGTLEGIIGIIKKEGLEGKRKDILGKCYLLLGAIYEKKGESILAEENYIRAKKEYRVEAIEGIDLESLNIYKKIMKGVKEGIIEEQGTKRKKKFPLLLVVGVATIGGLIFILLKKDTSKNRESENLHIESEPKGAEVYIDGQIKGVSTPCDFYISLGNHEIRLVKNGYGETTKMITFEENKTYNIKVKLPAYIYKFEAKWGSRGSGNGQFNNPLGISVYENNYVYVVDNENNRIQKFDSNGAFISKWGSKGSGDGQFDYPYSIALGKNNYVFVTDFRNNRVQKFDSNGAFISKWGSKGSGDGQLSYPIGISIDKNNYVYVTDSGNYRVQKFDSNGEFISKWGSWGTGNGQFCYLKGVAIDKNNYIYVADSWNCIQKFDSNGAFISKWGSKGSGYGEFSNPYGIAVDINNYVYVSDFDYNHIQKFDSNGIFITRWGSSGIGNGQFSCPSSIVVDVNGIIFISEACNNRIQKFKMSNQTDGDGEWEIITTNASTFSKKTFLESFHKKFDKKRDRRDKNLRN